MLNDSSSAKQGPDNAASRVANSARSIRTRGETSGAGTQGSASRQYSQAVAREILKVAGFHDDYGGLGIAAEQREYGAHLIVIDETGVSPNAFIGQWSLLWKPCLELMDGPDTPDATLTAGLPFPFDALQLAMFMLDGPGAFVTTAFGGWQIEPDRGSLDSMGIYANRAREAVRAAFAAYHQAVGVVGEGHLEPERQEAEAHHRYKAAEKAASIKHNAYRSVLSRDQYWIQLELVKNEVAPLSDQRELAMKRSASARSLWRKAMVKELSRLSALQTEFHSQGEVVADTSVSGGVELDKAAPLPLTTCAIAYCFAGLRWNEEQWKKPLGDKPKWLVACIAIPGVRGVSETRWNPVLIGAAVVRAGHAKRNSILARFRTKPELKPWFDTWKTYEADNFDTE